MPSASPGRGAAATPTAGISRQERHATALDAEEIFLKVREALVRSNRELAPTLVHKDASLVNDLGMDSMRLAALVAEIKAAFGDVDMTGWYVTTARRGADTVSGLVEFLSGTVGKSAGRVAP